MPDTYSHEEGLCTSLAIGAVIAGCVVLSLAWEFGLLPACRRMLPRRRRAADPSLN